MKKLKFYQEIIIPTSIQDVKNMIYPLTLNERIGDGKCTECGKTEWIIKASNSSVVTQGGKIYIECFECGCMTHL